MKTNKQPVLSICIPTWNRSSFLRISLDSLFGQLNDIEKEDVEIFISDNCSSDATPNIIEEFIDKGMPITVNRNEENIGAARNFIKCMQWASGKYIILLGDDDFLLPGSLLFLVKELEKEEYGLIHIVTKVRKKKLHREIEIFNNREEFLEEVSFWFTFMSGNIFRKDIVTLIANPEQYIHTHLLQMPFFLKSALSRDKNLVIYRPILKGGADGATNGGYNFYEVFVKGYLDILMSFVENENLSICCFNKLKRDLFLGFLLSRNYKYLILKQNVVDEKYEYKHNRKGFKTKGGWDILHSYYGHNLYYYLSFVLYPYLFVKHCIKCLVGR